MSLFRFAGRRNRRQASNGRRPLPTRLSLECLEARALVTADLLMGVPLALYSSDQTDVPLSIAGPQSGTSQATVTPICQEYLTITDANDQPITGPLAIGQTFWVDFSVQDLRTTLADAGITEAHTNIAFDPTLATPTGTNGTFQHGANYTFGVANSVQSPGLVQIGALETFDVNNSQQPFLPLGTGIQLVGRGEFTVTGAGPITFTTQFPTNLGGQDVLVADVSGTQDTPTPGTTFGPLMDSEVRGASVTINAPSVSLSGGSVTAGATATSVPFTVTLSAAESNAVTVDYQTQVLAGDNAVPGTDFTPTTTGQVTIPANATSTTFQIPVTANTQPQAARTFHVSLTGIDPASVGQATINSAASTAAGTINFSQPSVNVQNASVTETTSIATQMSFQVTLTGTSAQPITVQYKAVSQTGDTAVGGTDITAPGVDYYSSDSTTNDPKAPPLVINPGNSTGTITIPIAAEQQGSDKTFHLVLTGASGAVLGASAQATGTIVDDVNVPVASVGTATAANGAAGTTINFPVTLSVASTQAIVLDYTTQTPAGDTAVAGTDFGTTGQSSQVTGMITIPANQTTATISIPILGSSIFQPDKTLHVAISVDSTTTGKVIAGNTPALGTITSTIAKPTATIADGSVAEPTTGAATMPFVVSLSAKSGQDVTIHYNTITQAGDNGVGGADATAQGVDYMTVTGGTLVIPAGQLTGTISVPIAPTELAGPDRTFHVVLTDATGGGQLGISTAALGTIQIQNTVPQPAASIQTTATIVEPTTGSANMPFTVTLSAASRVDVVLHYATTAQTAAAGTDYGTAGQANEVSGDITIPALQTTSTFMIPILANANFTQDRTFQVTLTAGVASNATVAAGQSVGTIVFHPIFASIQDSSVVESTSTATTMTFTASLKDASNAPTTSDQDVTIHYQTVSQQSDTAVGGATIASGIDYQSVTSGTLVIPAGHTSGTFTINIAAELSGAAAKTFHVELLNSSTGAVIGNGGSAVGTISQNIPAPTVSIGTGTALNATAGATLSMPITLSAASAKPITIDYTTQRLAGDIAVAGTDYGSQGIASEVTGQVTLPAGATTATISIPILGTSLFEPPKTFHVDINVDPNSTQFATIGAGGGAAAATITNNNARPTVSVQNATVTETSTQTATMNFLVSLVDASNATTKSGQDVTITYSTQSQTQAQPKDNAVGGTDLTAAGVDYQTANAVTVTIPAGQSTTTISIPIAAELAGDTKTFHVVISSVTGGATIPTSTVSALGTIVDNVPQPTASIQNASLAAPSVSGQSMTFTVTLSAPSGNDVSFNFSTSNITAVAGQDYGAISGGTVVIKHLQTTGTFSIPLFVDGSLSVDKSFSVNLSALAAGGSNATLANSQATGTILAPVGSFSGTVYVDTNNDGVKQSVERGIAGVAVTLSGTTTSGQLVTMSTTTAADGSYSFQGLLPGTYSVIDAPPAQYILGHATPAAGVLSANNTFSFDMSAGTNAVNNTFAERGLQPQLITKRMFLGSVIH